uniref:Na(+)/H(+) exchange regulatory cofactor NHE-RF n=1 Tax=Astyanax mexicanus TaxID=7994 RepID=A0A3B1IJQ7_ASTMX
LSGLQPRLCYLTKGDRGFGFHLHGERHRGAQFIRKIEPGSPADLAGLRSGDRVVEVNGENVEKDSHHQVVEKIMAVEHRTRLLVVDRETDEFLRFHNLPCTEELAVETGCLSPRASSLTSSPRTSCSSSPLVSLSPSPRDSITPPFSRGSVVDEQDEVMLDLRPRLCCMALGNDGYGFNLHCDKSRVGQFVRSVDPDSPADRAGLRPGDRVVEVNHIEGMKHAEVVAFIRHGQGCATLLVVDPETDTLFKRLGITPTTEHLKGTVKPQQLEDCVDGPLIESPVSNCPITDSSRHSAPAGHQELKPQKPTLDPFIDSGLRLSPTAAEAKQKVRAKKANKRAPPMDWSKKQELFSNF